VTGGPPPPTTKLAILYKGGYESQMLFNAAGYGIDHKFALWKTQLTAGLDKLGITQKLDKLEFQRYVQHKLRPTFPSLAAFGQPN